MNRFKEFRRTPVKRGNSSANPKKSPRKKSPGNTQSPSQPWLASGEDSVSFERHNRVLRVEFSKTRRNQQVVADLMDRTFPFRRKAILEKVQDLDSLFKDFPFLQESDQVWCVHRGFMSVAYCLRMCVAVVPYHPQWWYMHVLHLWSDIFFHVANGRTGMNYWKKGIEGVHLVHLERNCAKNCFTGTFRKSLPWRRFSLASDQGLWRYVHVCVYMCCEYVCVY